MESTVFPGSLATVVESDQTCQVEGQGRGSEGGRGSEVFRCLVEGPMGCLGLELRRPKISSNSCDTGDHSVIPII